MKNFLKLFLIGLFMVNLFSLHALRKRRPPCVQVTQEDCMKCCGEWAKNNATADDIEEANRICLTQCPGNQEPFNVDLPY